MMAYVTDDGDSGKCVMVISERFEAPIRIPLPANNKNVCISWIPQYETNEGRNNSSLTCGTSGVLVLAQLQRCLVVDVDSQAILRSFKADADITCCEWTTTNTGNCLVVAYGTSKGNLVIKDIVSGGVMQKFHHTTRSTRSAKSHKLEPDAVVSLEFSEADSAQLVVCGTKAGQVYCRNLERGQLVERYDALGTPSSVALMHDSENLNWYSITSQTMALRVKGSDNLDKETVISYRNIKENEATNMVTLEKHLRKVPAEVVVGADQKILCAYFMQENVEKVQAPEDEKSTSEEPAHRMEKVKKIILMDIIEGKKICETVLENDVICMKFSPDGKTLVAAIDAGANMSIICFKCSATTGLSLDKKRGFDISNDDGNVISVLNFDSTGKKLVVAIGNVATAYDMSKASPGKSATQFTDDRLNSLCAVCQIQGNIVVADSSKMISFNSQKDVEFIMNYRDENSASTSNPLLTTGYVKSATGKQSYPGRYAILAFDKSIIVFRVREFSNRDKWTIYQTFTEKENFKAISFLSYESHEKGAFTREHYLVSCTSDAGVKIRNLELIDFMQPDEMPSTITPDFLTNKPYLIHRRDHLGDTILHQLARESKANEIIGYLAYYRKDPRTN